MNALVIFTPFITLGVVWLAVLIEDKEAKNHENYM